MKKVYTYDYDSSYDPAMPVVDFVIGKAGNEPVVPLTGLVDSGADASIIPINILEQIHARQHRRTWMRGTAGGRRLVNLYLVSLRLGFFEIAHLTVVADDENNELIIGRDVLNHLEINLNGPASMVEIATE